MSSRLMLLLGFTALLAPGAEVTKAKAPPPPAPPAEEEDEADPMLASGSPMYPWTDNQRRVVHHWFLPGATSLPEGDWYYRISHVARDGYDREPRTNLFGLDDNVKMGLTLGWSPIKAVTVTVQRINGRDLAVEDVDGGKVQYDTFDVLAKFQLLDQRGVRGWRKGPCDLSLIAGQSLMFRNHGNGDGSLNLGVIAERDVMEDRLRLGVGLVRAGLSAYDGAIGHGAGDKLMPDEQDYLSAQGAPYQPAELATMSIPLTARLAIAEHWCLLGEAIIPVQGWKTEGGPSLATGFAYNTNTHEFAFILTNTANAAFNSVITGGSKVGSLPFFAFSITAYL